MTSVTSDLLNDALRLDSELCQAGHHMVVTVNEQKWKYRWAAYKLFDEPGNSNDL